MNTVQHIAFNCTDIARQEAFYTRHVGFRRSRVFNAPDGNRLELMQGYQDQFED